MVGEDGGEAERGERLDDGVVAVQVGVVLKLRGSEEVVAVDVERRVDLPLGESDVECQIGRCLRRFDCSILNL